MQVAYAWNSPPKAKINNLHPWFISIGLQMEWSHYKKHWKTNIDVLTLTITHHQRQVIRSLELTMYPLITKKKGRRSMYWNRVQEGTSPSGIAHSQLSSSASFFLLLVAAAASSLVSWLNLAWGRLITNQPKTMKPQIQTQYGMCYISILESYSLRKYPRFNNKKFDWNIFFHFNVSTNGKILKLKKKNIIVFVKILLVKNRGK